MAKPVHFGYSLFSEMDIYLFKEGRHFNIFDKLGAHIIKYNDKNGVYFALWAPNAKKVSVIGDFNNWNIDAHDLSIRWDSSGIWEGFIPNLNKSEIYKYHIVSKIDNHSVYKTDPVAFFYEEAPKTASIVWDLNFNWKDQKFLKKQKDKNNHNSPISIYELHLGCWKSKNNSRMNYRELAHELVDHIKDMEFTHVELLPIMEHPFYGSWGYQSLGYFAPTSRYGSPQDFMYFVDYLHQHDIGVILDWVAAHFPNDEHGLALFDGSALYEHQDPKKGFHPDWNSLIFNYGRNEIINFLVSSAMFWIDKYHIDGIRMDAVASMLYLDYSRKDGEWIPNVYGGKENLEAINFIRIFNDTIHKKYPNVITIAEESTAWPMITKPTGIGGLGFDYKWNMGWMHDILRYLNRDPIHRKYHHEELTFSMIYAYHENFLLSLSHDEVVHGKGSLLNKMPGDEWQKFANLRLLFGYKYTHPGKKLLFMGMEFGEQNEWNHEEFLNWNILENSFQIGLKRWVKELNFIYRKYPQLHEIDFSYDGFEWIDFGDYEKSIISYLRKGYKKNSPLLVVCNFTPTERKSYRIGVPHEGAWRELINSDREHFKGSNLVNSNIKHSEKIPFHNRPYSIEIILPPLGMVIFERSQ